MFKTRKTFSNMKLLRCLLAGVTMLSFSFQTDARPSEDRPQQSNLQCANQCFEDYEESVRDLKEDKDFAKIAAVICFAPILPFTQPNENCDKLAEIEAELEECLQSCVEDVDDLSWDLGFVAQ